MSHGEPTTIECDTQEDFSRTGLFNVTHFSLSESAPKISETQKSPKNVR
jgi:hypothetical protein